MTTMSAREKRRFAAIEVEEIKAEYRKHQTGECPLLSRRVDELLVRYIRLTH